MKTPAFWTNRGQLSTLLAPLGWGYALATYLRFKLIAPREASVPVICVGNLTAGGTGKTPVCLALAKKLQACGHTPHFITRGYKGSATTSTVNLQTDTAATTGDEPLLLARCAPTHIAADRLAGAVAAHNAGADMVIMDDGFQNPAIVKDLSFVVVDGPAGFGNGRAIPAGPLRETIAHGLARAHALILIGTDSHNTASLAKQHNLPVFNASFAADSTASTLPAAPCNVLAFAGIGRPQKFYQSLTDAGYNVALTHDFADHHSYTAAEFDQLCQTAQKQKLALVTTAKDAVRLTNAQRKLVHIFSVGLNWQNENKLDSFLQNFSNRHKRVKR